QLFGHDEVPDDVEDRRVLRRRRRRTEDAEPLPWSQALSEESRRGALAQSQGMFRPEDEDPLGSTPPGPGAARRAARGPARAPDPSPPAAGAGPAPGGAGKSPAAGSRARTSRPTDPARPTAHRTRRVVPPPPRRTGPPPRPTTRTRRDEVRNEHRAPPRPAGDAPARRSGVHAAAAPPRPDPAVGRDPHPGRDRLRRPAARLL